ncbi:type I polyketide synthase [Streptomyces sp. NPDC088387]|uniref:type I polyketide synthase n=1 Tax=Streptomyces sp. NPDC088387 TaxID=3365859 RepID=UPI003809318F
MARDELIRPVHEFLKAHARRSGERVAFSDASRTVTYAALEDRTARLAAYLTRTGLRRGDRVAILLGNRVDMVESCLAVLRAGTVGVPLNPRSSDAELAHFLQDSGAAHVITDAAHLARLRRLGPSYHRLGLLVTGADTLPADAPDGTGLFRDAVEGDPCADIDGLGLDDPAWMLYTSGTTHRPKGVLSTQRAALWSTAATYAPVFGLSPQDRLLWPLPLFHSFSHSLAILGVTAVGASAHIAPVPLPPGGLWQELRTRYEGLGGPFTMLAGVPATYHQLVASADPSADETSRPAPRMCVVAGAPSPPALRRAVEEHLGAPLLDAYGSTETCGMIAVNRPGAPTVEGSCGPPAPGMDVRIVDPAGGGDLPDGAEGEIWVRGPSLMTGYHDQPEATAAALRDGWYRTGDLGRRVEHGHLRITGRVSEVIIRGGENIHPTEIEQVILACPGVADAVVVGMAHDVLGEVPVAFVVPGPDGFDTRQVLAACRDRLSDYKVPAEIREIAAVPRTASGKIARHAVVTGPPVAPPSDTALSERLRSLPPAERERALRDAVLARTAEACRRGTDEPLDPDSPFIDLGLTSVGAVELVERLRTLTGLPLPTTLVFDHPTPADVVRHVHTLLFATQQADSAQEFVGDRDAHDQDPVVIVAMACRYPGDIASPEDLWELVSEGRDATSEFPADRGWDLDTLYDPDPDRIGTTYTRSGGFLHRAADFDANLFGIAPREALATDPQQRLLLETSWEVWERAGIDPAALRESDTGVFVGVMYDDYATRVGPAHELEAHLGLGSTGSVASGRISYVYGLNGPAVTVDTACSSSLVALHWAARALRSGECSLALAGGVTVMATPNSFLAFSRQRGLSPDGRCKSFSATADGTAWGEGVGLVLLERLSDARRHGHPVLAVLEGSAVNSDGASNGLTAPHGPAQQRLITQALADAGLRPSDVDAVEAHGTGTRLGDPIEAQALLATYGQEREQPLWLGSVKSNLGHTQAAAGVAGVIKMVQAMRHGELPRTLHAEQPTPHVDWTAGRVELLTRARPWPTRTDRPRRAGVSAFGIGGTNAHVILAEAGALAEETGAVVGGTGTVAGGTGAVVGETGAVVGRTGTVVGGTETVAAGAETCPVETAAMTGGPANKAPAPVPWLLSAADEGALRAQAGRLAAELADRPDLLSLDVGHTLSVSRAALTHRALIPHGDRPHMLDALRALAVGRDTPGVLRGLADREVRTAFLFTGQGSQRARMGGELRAAYPVFAEALDEVCRHLDDRLEQPLSGVLSAEPGSPEAALLDRTDFTQAGLFAFEVALFRLLESWGVHADHLVGHSVGELAAAHVAGVLDLPDAAELVAARGRLMQALPEGGAMVALEAAEDEVRAVLGELGPSVSIAAVNGPRSVVISGASESVLAVATGFEARGRRAVRLRVSHAFHSPLVEPMLDEFRRVADGLTYRSPRIPVISTLTGRPAEAGELSSPEYWVRHARQPVRFADAVRRLADDGATAFLEIGPGPALTASAEDCLTGEDESAAAGGRGGRLLVVATRSGAYEPGTLLSAVGQLYVRGAAVDWTAVLAGSGARRVDLPTYAFQRQRYWLDVSPAVGVGAARDQSALLGPAFEVPGTDRTVLTARLSVATHPWLADHVIAGRVVVPATVFVEMAVRAGDAVGCGEVAELVISAPLVVPGAVAVRVQVVVGPEDDSARRSVDIYARPEDNTGDADDAGDAEEAGRAGDTRDVSWTRHVTGHLAAVPVPPEPQLTQWPPQDAAEADITDAYADMAEFGLAYGPAFRGVRALWRRGEEIFAEVRLPETTAADAGTFGLHPALLDAASHASVLAVSGAAPDAPDAVRVPFAWSGVSLYASGATEVRVRITPAGPDTVSLTLTDPAGGPVAQVRSLTTRELPSTRTDMADDIVRRALLRPDWSEVALPDPAEARTWAVRGPDPLGLAGFLPAATATPHDFVAVTAAAVDSDPLDAVHELTGAVLPVLQEWQDDPATAEARLVVVTRDATAPVPDLAGAAVWGLVRAAQSELPGRIVLIDVDGRPESLRLLPAAVASGEPQLSLRAGRARVERLAAATGAPGAGVGLSADGTVLITGGTGALGAEVARHLVAEHGVRHLLLTGRRGPQAPGAKELRRELEELGAEADIVACDTADRAALPELISQCEPPLTAVVHAAGVLDDGVLNALTPERMAGVLHPKADGAWHLHELTRHLDLSAFVLFSSVSGLLGRAGQGNYAAANTFLDALARRRVAEGLPAVSLAWGPWEHAGGMAVPVRQGRDVFTALSTRQGLDLFDAALRDGEPVLAPILLDRAGLRSAGAQLPPLLRGLVRVPGRPTAASAAASGSETTSEPGSWLERMAQLPIAERESALVELLGAEIAAVLGYPGADALPVGKNLADLGFDSLTAVQVRNRLSLALKLRLPAAMVFEHRTTEELARHVLTLLDDEAPAPQPSRPERPTHTLAALFHQVSAAGQPVAATHLLVTASWALPTFTGAEGRTHALPPIHRSRAQGGGPDRPTVVYFPAHHPSHPSPGGDHPRFHGAFRNDLDVMEFPHPGIGAGTAVPEDVAALAVTHAESVLRSVGDGPLVIVGQSAGGNVAHAVTRRLERAGRAPLGLVLLDTYRVTRDNSGKDWLLSLAGPPRPHTEQPALTGEDDSTLAAMGAYHRIFLDHHPEPVDTPTLLVRATQPTPAMAATKTPADWRTSWPLPHETVDVPGNHLTMMTEHAQTTASAIRGWIEVRTRSGGG